MSGEYRDELGAAHARIAELEEKVRALEEPAAPSTVEGRFPELEATVAKLRKSSDPAVNARGRTTLTLIGAMFPMLGMVLTYFHQPVAATMCSVVFISIIAATMYIGRRFKVEHRQLVEAEAKLADARRIAELEAKLADTKVRIAAPAPAIAEELDDAVEREAAAQPLR